jgi:DNA-binding NarL/FixJ family response regulator
MEESTANEGRLSVVICDDHPIVLDALRMAVVSSPQLVLAAVPVTRAEDAVETCRRVTPDVCVIDVNLATRWQGIEATRDICRVSPDTNVLVLSAFATDETVFSAIEAGAVGFVHKGEPVPAVVAAIVDVGRGRTVLDHEALPGVLQRASAERSARADAQRKLGCLSAREGEVLDLLRAGKRNDDIAADLFISTRTVETHVQHILRKLGVHSKLEAVALAWSSAAPAA